MRLRAEQRDKYGAGTYVDTSGPQTVRLAGVAVSPALFPLLRTRSELGQLLLPEDAAQRAEPVVVLAYGFWKELRR